MDHFVTNIPKIAIPYLHLRLFAVHFQKKTS